MDIYILHCDVDGGTHGCYGTIDRVSSIVSEMVKSQPFDLTCRVRDFYAIKHILDSSCAGEMINMEDILDEDL